MRLLKDLVLVDYYEDGVEYFFVESDEDEAIVEREFRRGNDVVIPAGEELEKVPDSKEDHMNCVSRFRIPRLDLVCNLDFLMEEEEAMDYLGVVLE